MRRERWLTVAGSGTWMVSALPTLFAIADGRLTTTHTVIWAIAFVSFGVAFALMCLERPGPWLTRPMRIALLAIQTIAGLAMVFNARDVFPAATLVVVAGQLDDVPPRLAAAWLVAQTLALTAILMFLAPIVIA